MIISLPGWTRFITGLAAGVGAVAGSIVRVPHRFERVLPKIPGVAAVPPDRENLHRSRRASVAWTATRLKDTLRTNLDGQRVIVVANREPVIHEWMGNQMVVRHPASGLVTALEPVMRACSGVWVAHGSGSADRAASDAQGRIRRRRAATPLLASPCLAGAGRGARLLLRLRERGAVAAVSSGARASGLPTEDWAQYQRVNQRFADAVAAEADSEEPIVLVQDYHFALVPRMLRQRFPRATILTFWHIPWPNAERFAICPHQDALLDGLLGSSIVGFQTPLHCHNFLESVDRSLEARVARQEMAVVHHGRTTAVRAVSDFRRMAQSLVRRFARRRGMPASCPSRIFACVRTPGSSSVSIVSTTPKGSRNGCRRSSASWNDGDDAALGLAIIQIAAPSRTLIDRYREFGDRVRATSSESMRASQTAPIRPVIFVNRHCEPPRDLPLLPRGRRLLRQQSARRDESRRQGVRLRSGRRARRAGPESVRWCVSGIDGSVGRQSVRRRWRRRYAAGGVRRCRPSNSRSGCGRCVSRSPHTTCTDGRGGC